jgi:tryptophan-rich sensory protein
MDSERSRNILKLVISIVACQCAGLIGSIFTMPAISTWYETLAKPSFTPPNWLFAPAWVTLYVLMGVAVFLVWRKGLGIENVKAALITFLVQLVLNVLWSAIFFGAKSLVGGAVVIVLLWIAILFTILRFFKISTVAGGLLIPYILWVTFASALNISILALNI